MPFDPTSTIVAPATGSGGAISIIRVSGAESFAICDMIFRPSGSQRSIAGSKGYTVIYGDIVDDEKIIDDVLVTVFRSPHSYSGEDSVEISCHASPYIQQKILELLIHEGASAALPGEFTRRAFLNGRIDLSQAEAVADVIAAGSEAAHRLAIHQMRGGFSEDIKKLRSELIDFASLIELELDFGEEDVEFADRGKLKESVVDIKATTENLGSSFRLGNVIKNGLPVAIVGKPNAGKSTILNALLKDDRAIVSDIPGTTRDAIEDTVIIDGVLYRFIDTAGIRETADIIENLGIRKTYQKIEQAMVVMLVTEAADGGELIVESLSTIRKQIKDADKKLVIVINKSDLVAAKQLSELQDGLCSNSDERCILINANNDEDISRLKALLGSLSGVKGVDETRIIVTNARHFEALSKCSESLARVIEGIKSNLPHDLVAMDLRQAIYHLGEITGEIGADDILENIFRNFCIGK